MQEMCVFLTLGIKRKVEIYCRITKIMASGPITSGQIDGETRKQWQTFSLAPKSLWTVTAVMKLKDTCSLVKKAMTNLVSILKSRDITLTTKVHLVKAMVFPVVMYGCESWTVKKAERRRIDAFELWYWIRLFRVPWTCKEIQPVHPKGNQSWRFIARTNSETSTLKPPDVKSWLIWKDPDAGKDWKQEEKGMTQGEMVGWHHQFNRHEFA